MIAMQKVAHWRGLKSSKNFQKWASFQAQHFKNFLTPFAEQMLFGHEELWPFFRFEICISFFVCSKAKIILNLQITWRHRVIPSFCGVTNLHLADKQCPIPWLNQNGLLNKGGVRGGIVTPLDFEAGKWQGNNAALFAWKSECKIALDGSCERNCKCALVVVHV